MAVAAEIDDVRWPGSSLPELPSRGNDRQTDGIKNEKRPLPRAVHAYRLTARTAYLEYRGTTLVTHLPVIHGVVLWRAGKVSAANVVAWCAAVAASQKPASQ